MNKKILIGIGAVLVLLLSASLFQRQIFKVDKPSLEAPLPQDILPLFQGIEWRQEIAVIKETPIGELQGIELLGEKQHAEDLDGALEFYRYYTDKMNSEGWEPHPMLFADGAGSLFGFEKDGEYRLFSYRLTHHNLPENEPATCPCDVAFSIFFGELREDN